MLTELDRNIIKKLQDDLPLVSEPYKLLAEELGITESDLLNNTQQLYDRKVLRRFGATLNHRKVGFQSNAMVVWEIPEERIAAASRVMVSRPQISHCYQRSTLPEWRYNLYTMIHGQSRAECEKVIEEVADSIDIYDYCILYSTVELKKTSMKYFSD